MRYSTILFAGAIALAATPGSASPLVRAADRPGVTPTPPPALVHHKRGHRGGPPWARRAPEPRRYSAQPVYTRVCRTEYRTRFDPYEGAYVREPVRTCREQAVYR